MENQLEWERNREREREREPLLRGNFGVRGNLGERKGGGGYCTIVEVDEGEEDEGDIEEGK